MSFAEHHEPLALGQLVTGTVRGQSFRYWVARNPKNKMNFARDYIETYEAAGRSKNKPRSFQNFHGYFLTPDGDDCIIVDQQRPDKFRTPQTADEKQKAEKVIADYKKKYRGVTPEQHLAHKEKQISEGKWKNGSLHKQGVPPGPPAGSIPVGNPRNKPPPPAQGFVLPPNAYASSAPTSVALPQQNPPAGSVPVRTPTNPRLVTAPAIPSQYYANVPSPYSYMNPYMYPYLRYPGLPPSSAPINLPPLPSLTRTPPVPVVQQAPMTIISPAPAPIIPPVPVPVVPPAPVPVVPPAPVSVVPVAPPIVNSGTWGITTPVAPTYVANGSHVKSVPFFPMQPRGNFPPVKVQPTSTHSQKQGGPTRNTDVTFHNVKYPTELWGKMEAHKIFVLCDELIGKSRQFKNANEAQGQDFVKILSDLVKELRSFSKQKQNSQGEFQKSKIGDERVEVDKRLLAFSTVSLIAQSHAKSEEPSMQLRDLYDVCKKNQEAQFKDFFELIQKFFEVDSAAFLKTDVKQYSQNVQRIFNLIKHSFGLTMLSLHRAHESHVSETAAVPALQSQITASGHREAADPSDDGPQTLNKVCEETQKLIQDNVPIHAPRSEHARFEYYKNRLQHHKESLQEDHSPAACLLALAQEKDLNVEYFRHCVETISNEFTLAINHVFHQKHSYHYF